MSTSIGIKLPKDPAIININDFGELIWWCNHLCITPEELVKIVTANGPSSTLVRMSICKPGDKTVVKNFDK